MPTGRLPLRDKLWKLLYFAHYRWLFGRRLPGAGWIARGVAAFETRTGRGNVPIPAAAWEEQYRAGEWSYRGKLEELPRYGVIAAYLAALCPGGAVLDVGCGEGLLRERLGGAAGSRFVGVDVAPAAIAAAAARADPGATFLVADAESWTPGERFDAVVFNDSLYYFRDPLATVERYRACLEPPGWIVLSMFLAPRTRAIARALDRRLTRRAATVVRNRRGAWAISVYQSATPAGGR
jgi:SAM-dependent methyltransferase